MNIARLEKLMGRMSGKVSRLTGLSGTATGVEFNSELSIAGTSGDGSTIGFNKQWLQNASRKEVKGVLAHELGHAAFQGEFGANDKTSEAFADSVRFRMGLGKGEGYDNKLENQLNQLSGAEFKKIAGNLAEGDYSRKDVVRMAGTDNNGPNVGDGGHNRNTQNNGAGFPPPTAGSAPATPNGSLPPLSPEATANYYAGLENLLSQYQNTVAGLKQQRVGIRGDMYAALSGVAGQKTAGLAQVENAGIERGMAGSSAVSQDLAGVRGAATAARTDIKRGATNELIDTRLDQKQAATDYFIGAQGLEAQKIAQQETALAAQLERNLIVSGQENTMDVLKQIYQSITASTNPTNKDQALAKKLKGLLAPGVGGPYQGYNGMQDSVLTADELALLKKYKGGGAYGAH